MKWERLGLVFNIKDLPVWGDNSFLQPTPLLLNEETIRVFGGIRDKDGVGKIGYVDLLASDPRKIIQVSCSPVLEPGMAGAFDDNGVVPSAVIRHEGKIYLYYAGYHLSNRVRFSVLGGLAISEDGGNGFKRVKKTPVFERNDQDLIFRVPHTVMHENHIWKYWYGGGDHFIEHNGYTYPIYDIRYVESNDPTSVTNIGKTVVPLGEDEYRVARPYVVKQSDGNYWMFYCYATLKDGYRLGFAESVDGLNWSRNDNKLGINISNNSEDWESGMLGYPSLIRTIYGTYLFYNGRNYGTDGFGCARLIEK